MLNIRSKLIVNIIRKKLYEEVDHILSISRQGFDVYAHIDFPEITYILINMLEQELKINSREFRIINDISHIEVSHRDNGDSVFIPTVLVGDHNLGSGYGFVRYEVRSPDQLLGHVATAVKEILDHFGLDFYLDAFDSSKLSRLKQIARTQGLKALIDAVIQTAYLGGFKGDLKQAQNYLDKFQFLENNINKENISVESCAKRFLSHVITHGDAAHTFLKSCLSYFVVNKQGHTLTRASQILSISRTTLQEHLKLAELHGVSSFFDGTLQKN